MTEEERLEAVKLLLETFRIGDQLPKKLRSKKKKNTEGANNNGKMASPDRKGSRG